MIFDSIKINSEQGAKTEGIQYCFAVLWEVRRERLGQKLMVGLESHDNNSTKHLTNSYSLYFAPPLISEERLKCNNFANQSATKNWWFNENNTRVVQGFALNCSYFLGSRSTWRSEMFPFLSINK